MVFIPVLYLHTAKASTTLTPYATVLPTDSIPLNLGTWKPFAVVDIIEQIAILSAAFSLLSQSSLEILFCLEQFPDSVEKISSYGGAALIHGGFIVIHAIQAIVLRWEPLTSSLRKKILLSRGLAIGDLPLSASPRSQACSADCSCGRRWNPGAQMVVLDKNLKDAIQQSREVLRQQGAPDPLHRYDLNSCKKLAKDQLKHITDVKSMGGHHHNHGFAAILADIIAHSVSLPTFFVAWLLVTTGVHVNALAVAWTVEISTLILLGCLVYTSIKESIRSWGDIGNDPSTAVKVRSNKLSSLRPLTKISVCTSYSRKSSPIFPIRQPSAPSSPHPSSQNTVTTFPT